MNRRTVWVTGASGGIGYQTVLSFAQAGYAVAAGYHQHAKPCLELQERFPNSVLPVQADISDRTAVEQALVRITERFGGVDILVNNAGIAQQKLFTDITDADWDRMMDINLRGAFLCCQAVLPGMIFKKSGKIINISSVWGEKGASCEVHYSASKAAVIGMTKALAKEEGLSGITVNCVTPGVIDTEMNAHLSSDDRKELLEETPLNRFGTAQDIADIVLFLASDRANFITGQVIGVNGGFGE